MIYLQRIHCANNKFCERNSFLTLFFFFTGMRLQFLLFLNTEVIFREGSQRKYS